MAVSLSARQFSGPRKGAPWSAADIEILLEMRAAGESAPAIARRLGRTVGAVYAEAKKAGSTVMVRKTWTGEETAMLRELYGKGFSEALIAGKMNRTPCSVRARVELLGLAAEFASRRPGESRPGDRPGDRHKEKRRPAHCRPAGHARRAHVPGEHGSWSHAEMDMLAALSGTVTLKEAASRVGRPLSGVRAKARHLGVVFILPRKDCTARDARLAELWAQMDGIDGAAKVRAIAEALGVSRSTVTARARDLGLRQARVRRRFDEAARAEIARLAPTMTAHGVACQTGWDIRTVRRVAAEDGLVFAERAPRPVKTLVRAPVVAGTVVSRPAKRRAARPKQGRPPAIPPAVAATRPAAPHPVREPAIATRTISKSVRKPVETQVKKPIKEPIREPVRRPVTAAHAASPAKNGKGSEERLQMMRDVLRKMKRKGYFPPDRLTGS